MCLTAPERKIQEDGKIKRCWLTWHLKTSDGFVFQAWIAKNHSRVGLKLWEKKKSVLSRQNNLRGKAQLCTWCKIFWFSFSFLLVISDGISGAFIGTLFKSPYFILTLSHWEDLRHSFSYKIISSTECFPWNFSSFSLKILPH